MPELSTEIANFLEMRKKLNSQADYRIVDFYDLPAEGLGQFDYTLFLGVLYHVEDPMRCLRQVAAVTREMCVIETQVVDDCPTAATDGLNVIYGTQFISSLSDPELRFVILHEALHKSLRHLTTWRHLWKKNPQRANAACDYVINLMLVDSCTDGFIAMPKVGLLDAKYAGMDAGEVFRLMEEEGDGGGNGHGFDEHEWGKRLNAPRKRKKPLKVKLPRRFAKAGCSTASSGVTSHAPSVKCSHQRSTGLRNCGSSSLPFARGMT